MSDQISIVKDDSQLDHDVEALYQCAFGPGRFAKAAARLREGNNCLRDCSRIALVEGAVIGACRLWPVVAANGVHALFLGPIAVDASARSLGLGKKLVMACLAQVDVGIPKIVLLVGDLSFFGPLGFERVPDGVINMPGPVDPRRLLWRVGEVPRADWPSGLLGVAR